MKNITIGIIAKDKNVEGENFQVIAKSNLRKINNKCNFIGILNYDNNFIDPDVIDKCDGIIFQGGLDIYPYHFQILNYAVQNNIPVLGICMGHQIIGLFSTGSENEDDLIKVEGHNDKKIMHDITIIKDSFLYKVFGDTLKVNSRHQFAVANVNPPFKATAFSSDNVIEAIEYIDDKHFILGVQFHPEDMENSDNLYNAFIKEVFKRKK